MKSLTMKPFIDNMTVYSTACHYTTMFFSETKHYPNVIWITLGQFCLSSSGCLLDSKNGKLEAGPSHLPNVDPP